MPLELWFSYLVYDSVPLSDFSTETLRFALLTVPKTINELHAIAGLLT